MDVNKPHWEKVLRKLAVLMGLLIVSPTVLVIGFKGIRKFIATPKMYFAYALTGIGIFLVLFTIFYGFKTFKTLLKLLFNQ